MFFVLFFFYFKKKMFFLKANVLTNVSVTCMAKNDAISNHAFDGFMQVNKLPSLIIQAERLWNSVWRSI